MVLEVLLYSQVLKMSDHENLRFYNDEEDIIFVPENSLKSIRKNNHRKRYRKKHGNRLSRKMLNKPNNVGAIPLFLVGVYLKVSLELKYYLGV